MFQSYSQSQHLQQINCAEFSHTSNHPLPFLAAHHIVKTPVSAHLNRPVKSSVREAGDDDESYSYPSPNLRPHLLVSSTSTESPPSPDPSESSIPSSSSSHVETWRTSLNNNGQVKFGWEGVSPSRSAKGNLNNHQFYNVNMQNPRRQQRQSHRSQQRQQQQQQQQLQQQQQQQQQQPKQLRQAMDLGGKISADYDDTPSQGSPSRGTVYTYTSDEMFGDSSSSAPSPEKHTMWILIYLSFVSPFLTLPIALYTLLTTPILILLSPLSLLTTSYPSLYTQFHTFLFPPINAQLDFILSSSTLLASDDDNKPASPVMLFLVNVLSPIYAIGIGLSAWVAALFWFYAAILGDPEGGTRDSKDDGRAAVLGVRRWWEGWLEQAR